MRLGIINGTVAAWLPARMLLLRGATGGRTIGQGRSRGFVVATRVAFSDRATHNCWPRPRRQNSACESHPEWFVQCSIFEVVYSGIKPNIPRLLFTHKPSSRRRRALVVLRRAPLQQSREAETRTGLWLRNAAGLKRSCQDCWSANNVLRKIWQPPLEIVQVARSLPTS